MRKFIIKLIAFFSPIVIILILFTFLDVFKVFKEYNDYYKDNFITLNRELVCAETYRKYRDTEKYNSFIFGSSRSQAFKVKEWSKYLSLNAKPFHFDASGEGIYGISKKIEYIDELGDKIDNALIIVDRETLGQTSAREGHLFIPPTYISKKSRFEFYYTFLKAQVNPKFILAYIDYSIFKRHRKYMGHLIEKSEFPLKTNIKNCDIWYGYDESIKRDSIGYYKNLINKGVFYDRSKKRNENNKIEIKLAEVEQLEKIKIILNKHNTFYKIVISPVYNQVPLEKEQEELLNKIFGEENVYNFAGKNKFTQSISNFYESSHYRPHVANEILKIIYE